MIPEGLKLEHVNRTLYWTTESLNVNRFDAKAVSNQIKELISTEEIDRVVVDNRAIQGAWSPEVDSIWIDLMRFMPVHVKKTATLCHDVIGKIQLNYLSSQAGTTETVKAFTPAELKEMKQFLGLEQLPFE